jgi:parallel beta-helix repeat protein
LVIDQIQALDRPDQLSSVSVTFTQPVNVAADALSVRNDSQEGTAISSAGVTFDYNEQTHTATWDFSSVADLPAGYYTLSLNEAQIESVDGSAVLVDSSFDQKIYVALSGDTNLDGEVDLLNDAFTLVGNLGTASEATWESGDFDGDGAVDLLTDAFALIGNLNTTVSGQSISENENLTFVQDAPPLQAITSGGITETNGIATLDVAIGSEINLAFDLLSDYLANNVTAVSGVVNVPVSTTFSEVIHAADDIVLNIEAGATLTLDQLLDPVSEPGAIRFTSTSNSGLTGAGTLDLNGNAFRGVYATRPNGFRIGNTDTTATNPNKLKIVGWQDGVFIGSSATVAATNITIENLEITDPHSTDVDFPLLVTNRPGVNGLWVEGVTIDNVLVDGGQPDGAGGKVGGSHASSNGFTADQITLQGVYNATATNVTSLNGGENGFTVSWGSRNVALTNITVDNADAHSFNLGGSGQAIDLASEAGFAVDQQVRGVVSGTIARVTGVFDNRIWVTDTALNQFAVGETLEVITPGVNVSTQITETYRAQNLTLDGGMSTNAGRNEALLLDSNNIPVILSDVFIQQVEGSVEQVEGAIVKNSVFDTLGREISPGVYAEHIGVNGSVSTFALSNNTFVDYSVNQTPVFVSNNALQLPGDPDANSIDGTSGNDTFSGTDRSDVIDGEGGNDTLQGGGGNDTIEGGSGVDTINGGSGGDEIYGGDDGDTLRGDGGNDVIYGGMGIDTINGGLDDDEIHGEEGDDELRGDGGADTIFGGAGVDTINGGIGDDEIHGDDGGDELRGDGGDDTIFGGEGEDTLIGATGNDTLLGGLGVDTINGGSDDDEIHGNEEDDILRGDGGADTIFGGVGMDTINGGIGNDELHGDDGNDELRGEGGDDTIFGGANDDIITGGDGNDTLDGGTGNDEFRAGLGNDSHEGGDGVDFVTYQGAPNAVTVDLQNASQNAGDWAIGDSHSLIENIIGSDHADDLRGDSANNLIDGGAENDTLQGNGGDDVLNGGNGNDLLIGGAGADAINGGPGIDRVSYETSTAGILLDLDNGSANTGDAAGDTFLNIQQYIASSHDDTVLGRAGIDHLDGQGGNDFLAGRGGNDSLFGGDGHDVLQGGLGADLLNGGAGVDTASYADATSGVRVYLDGSSPNGGIAVGDSYVSIENIEGTSFVDTLSGDENANQFVGGGGNDRFEFSVGWGSDTIVDFANNGTEKIDFRGNFGLTSVDDLTITDGVDGVTLAFQGDQILLLGLNSGDIDRLDFLFDPQVNHAFTINTVGDKPDVDLTDGLALDEDGNTSLRAAIMQANAAGAAATSTLSFDIMDGTGVEYVIQPTSALPGLIKRIVIDGSTQTGASVVIDGSSIVAGSADGLLITGDRAQVLSIGITGFSSDGIEVRNADDVRIENVQLYDNSGAGARLSNATNSRIRTSVITGNLGSGVQIVGTGVQGNELRGNRIGIGLDEVADGNAVFGVQVLSGGNLIIDNTVSGNDRTGIVISGSQATGNSVFNNRIGTDSSGVQAVGNSAFGVLVSNADNNSIGGTRLADRNIISGNGGAGVSIATNSSGTNVERNIIGLDVTGSVALGNGSTGVFIRAGANGTTVVNNFVAANPSSQIIIQGATTTENTLTQNRIGFGSGFAVFQGGANGVNVLSPNNTIGGPDPSDGNFIAGEGDTGVAGNGAVTGISLSGIAATGNLVQNNTLGTFNTGVQDRGLSRGVQFLQGAANNEIVQNFIAYSDVAAIRLTASGGSGNTFSENRLHANAVGIDLPGSTTTINDPGDADSGPNQLQNSPVVELGVTVVLNPTDSSIADITVTYLVDSDPANASYALTTEFFLSGLTGQDAYYVGSDTYTASDYALGLKTVTFTGVDISGALQQVTLVATATDDQGNSSELSLPVLTIVT